MVFNFPSLDIYVKSAGIFGDFFERVIWRELAPDQHVECSYTLLAIEQDLDCSLKRIIDVIALQLGGLVGVPSQYSAGRIALDHRVDEQLGVLLFPDIFALKSRDEKLTFVNLFQNATDLHYLAQKK